MSTLSPITEQNRISVSLTNYTINWSYWTKLAIEEQSSTVPMESANLRTTRLPIKVPKLWHSYEIFKGYLTQNKLVNITCNDERNLFINKKQGPVRLLRCCSQYYMCQCISRECSQNNSLKEIDPWCHKISYAPCVWPKNECSEEECLNLDERPLNLFWWFIIPGILVITMLLVLIGIVSYRKYRSYAEKIAHLRPSAKFHLGIASRLTVDAVELRPTPAPMPKNRM